MEFWSGNAVTKYIELYQFLGGYGIYISLLWIILLSAEVTWTRVYLVFPTFTSRPNCYWPLPNLLSFYLRYLYFCPINSHHHGASEAGMYLSVSVTSALIFYLLNGMFWSKLLKNSGDETCLFVKILYRECNICTGGFSVVCWKWIFIYRYHLQRLTKTWSIFFYKCIIVRNPS